MAKDKGEIRKDADEAELAANLYLLHHGVIEMNNGMLHHFTSQMVEKLITLHIENMKHIYGAEGIPLDNRKVL